MQNTQHTQHHQELPLEVLAHHQRQQQTPQQEEVASAVGAA
jgi:hypothetical protein